MNNEVTGKEHRRDEEWADDEISLVDLALILVRRKWWAVGSFVVVMVAGLAYVGMQPEVGYSGEAAVELVPVPEGMIVEVERPSVAEQLLEPVRQEMESLGAEPIDVSEGGGKVRLSGRAMDADALRQQLQTGVAEVVARIESDWLPYARAAYEEHQADLARLRDRVVELQALADRERDAATRASLIGAEMAVRDRLDAEDDRAGSRGPLRELIVAGDAGHLESARVVTRPSVQLQKSRDQLIVALTFVLAVMLGLFAAFFAEFLANVRSRLN